MRRECAAAHMHMLGFGVEFFCCSLRLGGCGAFGWLSVEGAPRRVLALSASGVGVCFSAV